MRLLLFIAFNHFFLCAAQPDTIHVDEPMVDTALFELENYEVPCDEPTEAHFPGGEAAMFEFIQENVKYPDSLDWGQYRTYVQFVINTDGTLSDYEVVLKGTEMLGTCLIDVLKKMPTWIPSYCGEKALRTRYTMPLYVNIK